MTLQTDKGLIDDKSENLSKCLYAKNGESILNNDLTGMDYSDFANLLHFAEDIEKSRDFYSDQLDKLYFYRGIVLIISLFLFMVWLTLTMISDYRFYGFLSNWEILFKIVTSFMFYYVLILLLGVSFNSRVKKIKRKLRADQYALEEAVDLLREVQPILHHTNSQSKIKEIEFKLRLSRFNIGQQYEEPTSILNEILKSSEKKKL